ncbi:MAG TPA: glycosyltransferase family 4 protein [Pedobacter sp.]|jgi:glycosyltransferase involved in cell wall biosynthesis
MLRVAIINTFDAKDRQAWAGIPFYVFMMIQRLPGISVEVIVAPELNRNLFSLLKGFILNKILRRRYYTWADEAFLRQNKKNYADKVKTDYDLIITFQFYLVDLLKTSSNKLIYWNDATFKNLIGFYAGYSNLAKYTIQNGHSIQRKAFELSDAIIFSSDWAIQTAQSYYRIEANKLYKIPFASNLTYTPPHEEVKKIIETRSYDPIIFLFLAGDWVRKGGNEAVKLINSLNNKGYASELYVVGCNVPQEFKENQSIRSFGYINKNSKDGELEMIKMFEKSSFLILPTKADCTPVAFSEANSFGLPVITTNIGGISSVISNDVNGRYFEISNFAELAETYIVENLPGTPSYKDLCYSSFKFYNENLSWAQVEHKFNKIARELTSSVTH